MIGPVDRRPPLPDLFAELGATRAELERVAALARLTKAHVQLEGLLSTVQQAIAHGAPVAALSADAERIARSLDGLGADPERMAATMKLATQIMALCAPGGTNIET